MMLNAEQLSKAPAIKIYNTKKNIMIQVGEHANLNIHIS